jgi:mono/diheme cytochrome c family protein
MKRSHLILITIALLVALDVARSINARVGYAKPNEVWPPGTYADLTWPPGINLSSHTPLGQRIYAQRCAVCHGPDGRGNGPAAPSLIPRPRDFTLGLFKYKSTPPGQPPSTQDLENVVSNGLQSSAMPYFRDLLSKEEIHAVVDYIKNFSNKFSGAPAESIAIPQRQTTAESLNRGRVIYNEEGCAGCHGPDGRKTGLIEDVKLHPTPIRDLSAPWTFHGGSDPKDLWLRLTTGLDGSVMPTYMYALTPDQRWDVVNYVQSLARIAPWESGGKLDGRGQQSNLLLRGEYLVHAEMCGLCHTQINRTGIYRADDFYLAGGMRVGAYPHGVFVSRNLTSDKDTGIGKWSESQITNAFRNGRARAF